MPNRAASRDPIPEASPQHPVETIAGTAQGRARLSDRIDETAAPIHNVVAARVTVTILIALMATLVLPWRTCAAWTAVGLVLEVWCWFASRPRARGETSDWSRANFVVSYTGISLWWLLLGALLWSTGTTEGHATGANHAG